MPSVLWRIKKAREGPFRGIVFSAAKAHKNRGACGKMEILPQAPLLLNPLYFDAAFREALNGVPSAILMVQPVKPNRSAKRKLP